MVMNLGMCAAGALRAATALVPARAEGKGSIKVESGIAVSSFPQYEEPRRLCGTTLKISAQRTFD